MKIIGDGGHARVVRSVIASTQHDGYGDTIGFIAVGDNATRKLLANQHKGLRWAQLIHPSAILALFDMEMGAGTIIMAGAILQPGVKLGRHVIINTGATVDHDCVIEDYAHIAPGAHLCGGVHVGEGALVGVGVGIEPGVKIPAWSIVKRIPYVVTLPSNG